MANQAARSTALPRHVRQSMSEEQLDVVYGRGWLLTHYLPVEPANGPASSSDSVQLLASGTEPLSKLRARPLATFHKLDR